ncbi:MAG: phage adaptor protein [Candidatus Thorarchaeota archaeon]|jgi:hypothetical protein
MRNLSLLITQSRRNTENEDFSADRGIGDEEFIEYFNNAQDRIQALIQAGFPDVFQEDTIIDAVSGQEEYAIPTDAFLGTRIDMVEYSDSGATEEFYELKKASKRERTTGLNANPSFYIRRNQSILLQPKPESSGKIRITYQKKLPKLDVRRATVLTATLSATAITALTLDTSVAIDDVGLLEENFITVIDKNGLIKMKNIPIDAIDTGTGIVTVTAGFTFQTGETIVPGDFLLRGTESSTHSQLPDNVERYLETDIVDSFSVPDGDVNYVPILDDQFLGAEGET